MIGFSPSSRSRIQRIVVMLVLAVTLGACGDRSVPMPPVTPTIGDSVVQSSWYPIDQVVPSDRLEGIDLHVRAAERSSDGVVLHLSFYNNSGVDVTAVRGIDLDQTRLVGDRSYAPSDHSASFDAGIAPPQRWVNGGASVGTFSFAGASGDRFELHVPGFPPVPFTLDNAVAPPANIAMPDGEYQYDVEVLNPQLPNIVLAVESVSVQADTIEVTLAFVNRNPGDVTVQASITGSDAVLLDHIWQQYLPTAVDPAFAEGIAPPGDIWPVNMANTGSITFPRPPAGDVLLLAVPGFPLVRLPLRDGPATVAGPADLPPSSRPRPEPPTPTPRTGAEVARDGAMETLRAITDALAQGDRQAYLAAFVPELRAEQSVIFERLATLPLEDIAWQPGGGDTGTIDDGGALFRDYRVDLTHRIEGVDRDNVFVTSMTAVFKQHDDGWLIAELEGDQPFWMYGPTAARRSGAFWIFYRPAMEAELPRIEQEAQAALDDVGETLPDRVGSTFVMYVTASADEFMQLTDRSAEQFLGVAWARFELSSDGVAITNRAFYINGAAFHTDPSQDRQRTIAHELTHLVLYDSTMPYTPAWLSEGAAMYASDDVPTETIERWYREQGPAAISLEDLSGQTSLGHYGAEQTANEYAYSAFLTRYLIETYGEDRFFDFYDSFADVAAERQLAHLEEAGSDFDTAMQLLARRITVEKVEAAYGVDLAALEQQFEAWLGEQLDA